MRPRPASQKRQGKPNAPSPWIPKPAHEFRYHVALGRGLAGLRRNADALREARTGVELLPISKDAIDGPSVLEELAAVYAATGDSDAAIREIEHLLSTPGYL